MPKSKKLLKFVLDDGTDEKRVILSGIHAFSEPEQLIGKTLIAITNLPSRAMMGIDSCRREAVLKTAFARASGSEKRDVLHCWKWPESYTLTPNLHQPVLKVLQSGFSYRLDSPETAKTSV